MVINQTGGIGSIVINDLFRLKAAWLARPRKRKNSKMNIRIKTISMSSFTRLRPSSDRLRFSSTTCYLQESWIRFTKTTKCPSNSKCSPISHSSALRLASINSVISKRSNKKSIKCSKNSYEIIFVFMKFLFYSFSSSSQAQLLKLIKKLKKHNLQN